MEQGLKPDGSTKVRPVDDLSASGVNECTQPSDRIRHDGIDALFALAQEMVASTGRCLVDAN